MVAQTERADQPGQGKGPAVFDEAHLAHYALGNAGLAAEVVSLFLAQLPLTLAALDQAGTGADWRFAAHALKGSAAAVGAPRLQALAAALEAAAFPGEAEGRQLMIMQVRAAAAEFRETVQRALARQAG